MEFGNIVPSQGLFIYKKHDIKIILRCDLIHYYEHLPILTFRLIKETKKYMRLKRKNTH